MSGTHVDWEELESFWRRFGECRIVVVGDLILDEYIWGEAERLSPEAPVPVVRVCREEAKLGGAGNVAWNLCRLGAGDVLVVGVVGEDEAGGRFRRLLEAEGLSTEGVVGVGGRPTTRKVRVLARNQHVVRIDYEEEASVSEEVTRRLLSFVSDLPSGSFDAIVISDYEKGLLSWSSVGEWLSLARRKGWRILVDPKYRNFGAYREVDVLKPNWKELLAQVGEPGAGRGDSGAVEALLKRLWRRLEPGWLVVTAGSRGAYFYSERHRWTFRHVPAHPIELVDVTGAGDTFMGALALMYLVGASPELALFVANVAAGLTCQHVGTYAPGLESVRRACRALLSTS